ncbi:hypothetical protein EVAR_74839_1 [Eumeta japonica]|uniref:Uncharacterized protein n=1 Tax=Eumeta variegata TaxID=151549 RepID=A0A4C1SPQ1_EUMVA|nr:hypothetical protein EVAR_74839_1 [Eumeta japonica]
MRSTRDTNAAVRRVSNSISRKCLRSKAEYVRTRAGVSLRRRHLDRSRGKSILGLSNACAGYIGRYATPRRGRPSAGISVRRARRGRRRNDNGRFTICYVPFRKAVSDLRKPNGYIVGCQKKEEFLPEERV